MDNLLKLLDIDSCDNSSISEAVRNTLKDFEIEVNDTIEDLANESFGPFMITMFALFSQLTTALSTNLSSFLLTSVAGNVVGGLLSSAGLAINLLSGSQIVLKYQAAKRLSQVLQNRIGVSESLLFDIGELIDVLQSLENLNQETSDILFFDIDRAYENIKKAALLVGIEYGKIENAAWYRTGSGIIKQDSLDSAVFLMDQALKDLAGNQLLSPDFSKELNKINRKYTLPLIPENKVTTSVSIPNPLGIVDYFKNSVNELKSRYFLDNGQVSEAGKKAIKEYVIAFITTPGINEFFIKYAATRFTGKFINSIGKHLPIQSVLLKETGVVSPLFSNKSSNPLTSLTNNIRDSIDSVFDFLDIEDSQTTAEYSSPSINHATESRFVKLAETSIILLDQWIETLGYETGILRSFLGPALSNLKSVESGMQDLRSRRSELKNNSGKIEIAENKLEWITKINIAKTLVNSSKESPLFFGTGTQATPESIAKQFDNSLDLFEDLRTFILNRTVKEVTPGNFEEVPRESDLIAQISETRLQIFGAGGFTVVNPTIRKNAIAALQSIRLLLQTEITRDRKELVLSENFEASVERNILFTSVVKPGWDAFIKSLQVSPLSGELAESLLRGDLSTLLNAIQAGLAVSEDISDYLNCKGQSSQQKSEEAIKLAEIIGLDPEKAKKFTRKSEQAINRLKNKREIIGAMLNL